MTKLESTEANYQITCWYVLTRRALHGYRLNIFALEHLNIPAEKCTCIKCGQAYGGYDITTCQK
jgi:hypothetical protein